MTGAVTGSKVTVIQSGMGEDTPITVNAVHVGTFDHDSEEWHAARAAGIGGSEVSTIVGLNKWQSPYRLWCEKTGLVEREVRASAPMEWGNRLESAIIGKFEDEHPDLHVVRDVGTFHHVDREWQRANPDALYWTAGGKVGLIEVKTASSDADWAHGVPSYYEAQVQWYLDTLDLEEAWVIVLFNGSDYREFWVPRSRFMQEMHFGLVEKFREAVLSKTPPPIDGHADTYEVLRQVNSEVEDEGVELGYLGVQYFSAESKHAAAEKELNEFKSRIIDAMGSAKKGLVEGHVTFTRRRSSSGSPYLKIMRGK